MTPIDIALGAGAKSLSDAEYLLWNASAYPFGCARTWCQQIRHALRHISCIGDPEANCGSHLRCPHCHPRKAAS